MFWSDAPPSTDLPITKSIGVASSALVPTAAATNVSESDSAAYLATSSQGGGGGDTPLYSNLKVIAVPVLATIFYTAPLK